MNQKMMKKYLNVQSSTILQIRIQIIPPETKIWQPLEVYVPLPITQEMQQITRLKEAILEEQKEILLSLDIIDYALHCNSTNSDPQSTSSAPDPIYDKPKLF